jgi:N-acetylmuramoyl-L-alanine amidase
MNKKVKVCIDAGHGGKDAGAVNGKRYEKNDTLKIAMRLGKVLAANGIEVSYTRTTDVYDSPGMKAKLGNASDADYFISIHRNASTSVTASGVETLICNSGHNKYEIAKAINTNLHDLGFVNRGVKMRNNLAVLNGTKMPALLVEVGFISSKADNEILDKKFYSVVNAIAKGVTENIGLEFKTLTQRRESKNKEGTSI